MKSRVSFAVLALVLTAAQEPPPGDGPRGTSGAGEQRYDQVGRVAIGDGAGVTLAMTALPIDTVVEVTALDTGRTTLALVAPGQGGRGEIGVLSRPAAQAIGASGESAAVRVRPVIATPPEIGALRQGLATGDRGVAPAPLLAALRRKLASAPPVTVRPAPAPVAKAPAAPVVQAPKPAPVASARPAPVVSAGTYAVQVATLSDAGRANALAARIGGRVLPAGKLFRVQSKPLNDSDAATRERARVAALGYGDAQVIRISPQ